MRRRARNTTALNAAWSHPVRLLRRRDACCLRRPLGEEEGENGGEGQDLRHDVERDGQGRGRVGKSRQPQAANTHSMRARAKKVALVSRTMGDKLRSSSVVISTRNSGTLSTAR